MIFCALSKLDSRTALLPGANPVSRIMASEYAAAAECVSSGAYEAMSTAATDLYGRTISFYIQAKNCRGKPGGSTITYMRCVGRATYKKRPGMGRSGLMA